MGRMGSPLLTLGDFSHEGTRRDHVIVHSSRTDHRTNIGGDDVRVIDTVRQGLVGEIGCERYEPAVPVATTRGIRTASELIQSSLLLR